MQLIVYTHDRSTIVRSRNFMYAIHSFSFAYPSCVTLIVSKSHFSAIFVAVIISQAALDSFYWAFARHYAVS